MTAGGSATLRSPEFMPPRTRHHAHLSSSREQFRTVGGASPPSRRLRREAPASPLPPFRLSGVWLCVRPPEQFGLCFCLAPAHRRLLLLATPARFTSDSLAFRFEILEGPRGRDALGLTSVATRKGYSGFSYGPVRWSDQGAMGRIGPPLAAARAAAPLRDVDTYMPEWRRPAHRRHDPPGLLHEGPVLPPATCSRPGAARHRALRVPAPGADVIEEVAGWPRPSPGLPGRSR